MQTRFYTYKFIGLLWAACNGLTTSQAQNVMKVQPGAVISTKGDAVITLNNMDLDNDGTIDQQPGKGRFVFNGNAGNIISGTSSPLFDIFEIAKTGPSTVTLQQSIRVGSNITFTSGIIDLNQQNILLQPAALLQGESETSYITGINGGYVEITNTLTAPSAVNPGSLGLVISSTQDMGTTIIRRGHQSQSNGSGNGKTISRYYDVIPVVNTGLNATLRLNYLDAEKNSLDENLFTMWTSTNNQHWTNLGFTTRENTANFVEKTGINSLARFTVTENLNSLPLVWGSLNTKCVDGQTRIQWKSLQEQNTSLFKIRRSTDGIAWTDIGTVPAAGNSQSPLSYTYTDVQPGDGTNYYQIMQKDMDGNSTSSPVLTSQCGSPEGFKIYPNPVQNNCTVSIQSVGEHMATIRLYDNRGALLQQQLISILAGSNQYEVKMGNYAQGVYSLVVTGNDGTMKVTKLEKF